MTQRNETLSDDTSAELNAARHLRELRATAGELRHGHAPSGLNDLLAAQLESHATELIESKVAYTRAAAALWLTSWPK